MKEVQDSAKEAGEMFAEYLDKLALEKFNQAKVTIEVIDEENMPHIWPLLPVMHEAKVALKGIIERLNE